MRNVSSRYRLTLFLIISSVVVAGCHGAGGSHVLPPVPGGRRVSATAVSTTQWTSGFAGAPATITVSFPAPPAVGDTLVVAFWNNAQNSCAANTYTPPAGWALIDQNLSQSCETYQTFSHVVGAGETNQYVFTPAAAQRSHSWIGADVASAGGIDKAANAAFGSGTTTWTTPVVTPLQSGDLALVFQLPFTLSSLTWSNASGWSVGIGPTTPWKGEGLNEQLVSTSPVSESSTSNTSAYGFSAIVLLAPSGTAPPPTPAPTPTPTPAPTAPPGSAPSPAQWTSGSAGSPASITVSFPAPPASGDTLVVAFWNNAQSSCAPNTYTPPSGWSVADQNLSQSCETYQTFSHVASSGETGKYVFTPAAAQRTHSWIGADIRGAGSIDYAGNTAYGSGTVTWKTPSVTPSQLNELAVALDLPYTLSSLTWANAAGWSVGTGPTAQWRGEAVYQQLGSTSAVSETSTSSTSAYGFSALLLLRAGTAPSTPPPPAYTDWTTFGDNIQGTNYNPNETTLSTSNVAKLKLSWSKDLGSAITDQPVVATNVSIGGSPTTVAYIGTEGGVVYAINADTGATIWSRSLGTVATGCLDLPGGTFGITGTPTYDKSTGRLYVADGKAQVHALDMATGAEASGWPVTVTTSFATNHIYGALKLNPNNGLLYAATGSFCDSNSWNGRVVAINTTTASITATFFPASPYSGAGVWGIGGVAIDPATNDVYVATGNTEGAPTEYSAYGDQVVHLSATLSVVAANYPGLSGTDVDFGATPILFAPPGCPQETSTKNKSGVLVTYGTASIANGPLQLLNMAPVTSSGIFVGSTAYSPVTNLLYVGDPQGNSTFTHGLIALAPQPACTLALSWQQTVGPSSVSGDDNDSPTLANGVVYFTVGQGDAVVAFDAASGQQLWNSGSTITGSTQVAPTVDGRVFVSSWDHKLYAFGL